MIIKKGKLKFSFDKSWGKLEEMEKNEISGENWFRKNTFIPKICLIKSRRNAERFYVNPSPTNLSPFSLFVSYLKTSTCNGTVRFKKCKQLFEYQHLLWLRDI
jgi:hypothetical protein